MSGRTCSLALLACVFPVCISLPVSQQHGHAIATPVLHSWGRHYCTCAIPPRASLLDEQYVPRHRLKGGLSGQPLLQGALVGVEDDLQDSEPQEEGKVISTADFG